MANLKPLDYKILSELLRNAKVSDRQLAKKLGKSQPTITRRRSKLEGTLIQGYTIMPRLHELGFEIIAITFIAGKREQLPRGKYEEAQEKAKQWHSKHPNVIFAAAGQGLGWMGVVISIHSNYSDYVKYKAEHEAEFGEYLADIQSFLVDLNPKTVLKPLSMKYLSEVNLVSKQ
ncbi:MAG TPA: Lrp/AsnC family transcriptional regulator [Candidatus Bathyarchaeia archaeon]|nr:Lrp/AsnC family transcriptional regulator [Candidatus Bathyarchaeia archaeon]